MPKISNIEIFKTNLPFKHSFSHSLRSRLDSESIFVKISLDNGIAGFRESLPRHYVTGNTQDSVFRDLSDYASNIIGLELDYASGAVNFIRGLAGIEQEARCAIEIALLDALGKASSKPISEFLGAAVYTKFTFSLVVPSVSALKAGLICAFARAQGYKFMKVKVGKGDDAARVRLCRRIMPDANIRIDANGAWDSSKRAIEAIRELRKFNISSIEQPTPKDNFDALREVADYCAEPVIADESLCTAEDALKLARTRACDMFNVRVSKCGGIFRSLDIIRIAEENGLSYQIGCLVGETGILSAAARHMAVVAKSFTNFEGSYSRFLLKEDAVKEDLTPKRGIGYALNGCGLGVTVKEDVIRKYSTESVVV